MKKPILRLGLFCLYAIVSKGYSQTNLSESLPYIEVNGYAEKEVIPNEIYIGIILRERIENKEKISIEFQEKQLKESLNTLNIPISNLSMADANADYVKVSWQKRDVLTKKDYQLKVGNATTVGKVFQELEKLKKQFKQTEDKLQEINKNKSALENQLADPQVYGNKESFLQVETAYNKAKAEAEEVNAAYEKLFEKIMELESGL